MYTNCVALQKNKDIMALYFTISPEMIQSNFHHYRKYSFWLNKLLSPGFLKTASSIIHYLNRNVNSKLQFWCITAESQHYTSIAGNAIMFKLCK